MILSTVTKLLTVTVLAYHANTITTKVLTDILARMNRDSSLG